MLQEAPAAANPAYWAELLGQGYEQLQAQQAALLGKGKRERKQARSQRSLRPSDATLFGHAT